MVGYNGPEWDSEMVCAECGLSYVSTRYVEVGPGRVYQALPGLCRSSRETEGRRAMSERERPTVQQQMVFADGGEIEPEEGPVGTSLVDFGADVNHRERTTRIERASASEFGVDDRPEVRRTEKGEQGALFTSTDEEQRTLDGEQAAGRSLF